jgi:hypothetical protein
MSLTTWTNEQILSLAYDHLIVGAAETLVDPKKWGVLGCDKWGIWGEFSNKDKPSFHTLATRPNLALSCNCPSHKYPCRHGLGLALLASRFPANFQQAAPPEWVLALREKSASDTPITAAGVQQRAGFQRDLSKAQAGLDAYALWLRDMVHTGLAELPKKPAKYWVTMANRLAENGLFKLAHEVRQLPAVTKLPNQRSISPALQKNNNPAKLRNPEKGPEASDWPTLFLQRIGRHYLIAQGFSRYETLNADTRADLRYAAGWFPDPADDWPETMRDNWLVVGGRQDLRKQATIHHTWLWAEESARFAMLSRPFPRDDVQFQPFFLGATADATMAFHPGAYRFRVNLESLHEFSQRSAVVPPTNSLKVAMASYSHALSANPWLDTFPLVLGKMAVVRIADRWFLRDEEGCRWPLPAGYLYGWHLAALLPLKGALLFGEWNGQAFTPLSIRDNSRWLPMNMLRGIK